MGWRRLYHNLNVNILAGNLLWVSIYSSLCDVLFCIAIKKSFASSYAPKNTAPPALIQTTRGPSPFRSALDPSLSIILFNIVKGVTLYIVSCTRMLVDLLGKHDPRF